MFLKSTNAITVLVCIVITKNELEKKNYAIMIYLETLASF
jgi:hypothetical protein